jgi:hypothetical protein
MKYLWQAITHLFQKCISYLLYRFHNTRSIQNQRITLQETPSQTSETSFFGQPFRTFVGSCNQGNCILLPEFNDYENIGSNLCTLITTEAACEFLRDPNVFAREGALDQILVRGISRPFNLNTDQRSSLRQHLESLDNEQINRQMRNFRNFTDFEDIQHLFDGHLENATNYFRLDLVSHMQGTVNAESIEQGIRACNEMLRPIDQAAILFISPPTTCGIFISFSANPWVGVFDSHGSAIVSSSHEAFFRQWNLTNENYAFREVANFITRLCPSVFLQRERSFTMTPICLR